MPTVLILDGFRFYFFSAEGSEPAHIHVSKMQEGKFGLYPSVKTEYFYGFTVSEKRSINEIITANRPLFMEKWNEYFG